jgi:hypothetical protein
MKIIALLLSFALITSACGQSAHYFVTGKVVDKSSRLPLSGASVFAQNTTFGVATDGEGNFNLKLPNGGYELVVTFTGYQTESVRISSSDNKELQIEMTPKEKSLEEVAVVVSNEVKDGWQKYGSFFTENFIGKTKFSQQCTIKNPEVLKFYFSKKRNRLKVAANDPLVVMNDALGYKISFAIDSFIYEYTSGISLFDGYPLFEEMQGSTEQQAIWQQNRAEAYKGSLLHFMRSLFNKNLEDEGFEVQFLVRNNGKETPVPLKNIYGALNYLKDDSTNTVEVRPNQAEIAVMYIDAAPEEAYVKSDPKEKRDFQLSTLTFAPNESIIIEQNGYFFDQKDITTNDYWGFKKVGDMLPYDYVPPPSDEQ